MRVLMLGWEFPPFIAGGLGTACHGLTKAMARRGTEVTFVLPKVIDRSESSHVNLISPSAIGSPSGGDSAAPSQSVADVRTKPAAAVAVNKAPEAADAHARRHSAVEAANAPNA